MPDTDEAMIRKFVAQKRDQEIERPVMTELRVFGPRLLGRLQTVGPRGDEVRCRVDAFNLTADVELELVAVRDERRKLEARRPGVEDDDSVGHGCAAVYVALAWTAPASRFFVVRV
jgi:hypothetical protein